MKKVAIALFVILAGIQLASTISSGFHAASSVASINAKHLAMMEQAENN